MVIQITILVVWITAILFFARRLNRAKAAEASPTIEFDDAHTATRWNARSVGLKMAASAGITVAVVFISVLWVSPSPGKSRAPLIVGSLIFSAVTGALAGYCLALKDLVQERRARGQRVHPVLREYFSAGVLSMILWIVTGFAAGIGGIVFYHAVLSPGVRPATEY